MHDIASRGRLLPVPMKALRYVIGRLVTHRARWGLSLHGWLFLVACAGAASAFLLYTIHPFLAVTEPVGGDILVMEGWVHDFAVSAATEELKVSGKREIFTTGGPLRGNGRYTDEYETIAHAGASHLRLQGVPVEMIRAVPAREVGRDRTYVSALALRSWLHEHGRTVRSIDVVTEAVHARRTRLLFKEAFGTEAEVGVIAAYDPDYDPHHWWRYSEGVREVLGEAIAYVYAKVLFWPPKRPTD
jgi:hypothetical protein